MGRDLYALNNLKKRSSEWNDQRIRLDTLAFVPLLHSLLRAVFGSDNSSAWLRVGLPDGQGDWVSARYVRLVAGTALIPASASATAMFAFAGAIPAQLVNVVNGDTIKISVGSATRDQHYVGIDNLECDSRIRQ